MIFVTDSDLKNFLEYLLKKKYIVFAPVRREGQILIDRIRSSENFIMVKERPLYSFKKYLLPPKQRLFNFPARPESKAQTSDPKQVFFGITMFDLKAVTLLAQIFEKDSYFQNIISQTILIGQSPIPEETTFYEKYEENILEHIKFDIFLESRFDQKDFRVFTGSKHGQRMLSEFGLKDFEHIEYAGAIPEEGLSNFHKITAEKIKKSYGSKIWKDLGKRCLGCNKCSVVCPTCFCFKIYDENNALNDNKSRIRAWDSCFAAEFSEIAGGIKFQKTISDRIYNWYDHKFVRIPHEYSLPGCVGCGRCSEVCPAGINIKDEIAKIQKISLEPFEAKTVEAQKITKTKSARPRRSLRPVKDVKKDKINFES